MSQPNQELPKGAFVRKGGTSTFDGAPSFSLGHRLFRLTWMITWALLGAWTPPPMKGWRRLLLRRFGAQIHDTANVYGSVRIWYPPNLTMEARSTLGPGVDCYTMGPIHVGRNVIISQKAYLCTGTHDINDPSFQIRARPITLEADCWICADAFVGPGVTVGSGAVLSARGAVFRDMEPWGVYQGNPARKIKDRTRFQRDA